MRHSRRKTLDEPLAPTADVPRQDKPTSRHAPPASAGLVAGSDKVEHADVRRQRQHPAEPGRMTLLKTEQLVELATSMMDKATPQEIAIAAGVSAEARPVREIIKAARRRLAERAGEYVDIHMVAAKMAALDGDAKPAQWALEHIAEEGDRVVDAVKAGPAPSGQLQIGIAIGGVPQPTVPGFTVSELPMLAAGDPTEDTP